MYRVLLPLPVHNVNRVKMAMIVAASSFFHSLKDLEREERSPLLFLNPKTLYRGKNLRVLLEQQPLASKQIILWHDVLNNSISSHRTNNYTLCPLDELLAYLHSKRKQISAIVCCGRTSSPDIFEDLRKTEIIGIETTDKPTSRGRNSILRSSKSISNCTSQVNWN